MNVNIITWLNADDTEFMIGLEEYSKLLDMLRECRASYKIEDRVNWEEDSAGNLTKLHYKTLFIDKDTALFFLKQLLNK